MSTPDDIASAIESLVVEKFPEATDVEIRCGTLRAAMRWSGRRFKTWRDVFDHFRYEFDQARIRHMMEKA